MGRKIKTADIIWAECDCGTRVEFWMFGCDEGVRWVCPECLGANRTYNGVEYSAEGTTRNIGERN